MRNNNSQSTFLLASCVKSPAMTAEQIKNRLELTYADALVDVVDLTGTEDHYQVSIQTNALKGLTLIKQHKLIMSVFENELKTGEIHAFTLKTGTRE